DDEITRCDVPLYDVFGEEVYENGVQQCATPNPEYNPDNLVSRIQGTADAIDTDSQKTVQAFGLVATVLADQIGRVTIGGEPLAADLAAAADAYYGEPTPNVWICTYDSWQYFGYQSEQDCVDQQSAFAQEEKDAFLSSFVSGSISRSGQTWTVTEAVFDLDGVDDQGEDQVAIAMTVTVPTVSTETCDDETCVRWQQGKNDLAITGSADHGDVNF